MNSHFQSSETTWTVTGITLELIGLRGSRSWAPTHATPPTSSTVMAGIDQTSSSRRPEYSKSGKYASARIRCAKPEGDGERGEDRRNNDRQHDAERVEHDQPFGCSNGSFGVEDAFGAAAEREAERRSSE